MIQHLDWEGESKLSLQLGETEKQDFHHQLGQWLFHCSSRQDRCTLCYSIAEQWWGETFEFSEFTTCLPREPCSHFLLILQVDPPVPVPATFNVSCLSISCFISNRYTSHLQAHTMLLKVTQKTGITYKTYSECWCQVNLLVEGMPESRPCNFPRPLKQEKAALKISSTLNHLETD